MNYAGNFQSEVEGLHYTTVPNVTIVVLYGNTGCSSYEQKALTAPVVSVVSNATLLLYQSSYSRYPSSRTAKTSEPVDTFGESLNPFIAAFVTLQFSKYSRGLDKGFDISPSWLGSMLSFFFLCFSFHLGF